MRLGFQKEKESETRDRGQREPPIAVLGTRVGFLLLHKQTGPTVSKRVLMRMDLSAGTEPTPGIDGKSMPAEETVAQMEPLLQQALVMRLQALFGDRNSNGH